VLRLRQQRSALGDQQFQHVLRNFIDEDDVATIMQLTEQDWLNARPRPS